jgi:hypothetical protein
MSAAENEWSVERRTALQQSIFQISMICATRIFQPQLIIKLADEESWLFESSQRLFGELWCLLMRFEGFTVFRFLHGFTRCGS